VLDTNVLVSALLNPDGAPGTVLDLILSGAIELAFDAEIMSEYREVLGRPKFGIDAGLVHDLCDDLEAHGITVDRAALRASPLAVFLPPPGRFNDPDDVMFAEVGLAGEADAIVTGNKKHFAAVVRPVVLSPSEFLERFGDGEAEEP
jgi:predicted nucleic acid-binding protein